MQGAENNKSFSGDYRTTPLWDDTLSERERIEFLLRELTLEEKFQSLGTGSPEISRLGIPQFGVGGEGAHGVQARHDQSFDSGEVCYTTVFPNPIGMSATWDRQLIREAGNVVGEEARALFHAGKHRSLSLWAPTVDLTRDPRWGRLEECYGEDGYLTGEMAGAYVDGIQGDDETFLQCAATAKHFYANNTEEGRTYVSASVDLRNKYEYYMEPYRKLIQEHHLEGLMTAYNEVNGVPCMLLGEDLALLKRWGLGHVVSDGGDVSQTVEHHKYFSRHSETVAAALHAHMDCFTDDIDMITEAAKEAYQCGMISESDLDRALYHYFRVMLRLGFFDKEQKNPYRNIRPGVVSCREHRQLARKITAESAVLLKNEAVSDQKLLPLSAEKIAEGTETAAVIGPLCDTWDKGWYSGQPLYGVTAWEGIRAAVYGKDLCDDAHLRMESGICEVRIQIKRKKDNDHVSEGQNDIKDDKCIQNTEYYLGILPDSVTVGIVPKDQAEVFLLDRWEHGKVTLRARSNGRYLSVRDDEEKGECGNVTADSTEAFGWFVKEMFHLSPEGKLTTWDDQLLVPDGNGQLTKKGMGQAPCDAAEYCLKFEYVKDGIQAAVDLAEQVDNVVLCLGAHPMITCKEENDRQDILMSGYQQEMLNKIVEVNPNVILVLLTSVPLDISYAKERVPAILTMATGSMELGGGLADVLFGNISPAGRLNVTWYQSDKDLPPMEDYDVIRGGRTYQYFEGEVLYPFGHGLSYSSFEYGDGVFMRGLEGDITVKNVGSVPSDEVVQIYVRKRDSVLRRPKKSLVYFERLKDVAPGEERQVSFVIDSRQLEYYDVISDKMMLEPGEYEIMAGASSDDIRRTQTVLLQGEERGVRDGSRFIPADRFDTAVNYVLDQGHLSYQAVCSRDGGQEIVLTYQRVLLEAVPKVLVLDFWREYQCEIAIEIDGIQVGKEKTEPPVCTEEHKNWLTRGREIGFCEVRIPLREGAVPAGELFSLSIRWRGRGKLCMFRFEE